MQNLYELTFSIHQPPISKLLYVNAKTPVEALTDLLNEYDRDTLTTLSHVSIASYNASTGEFDEMDMKPECDSFVEFCRNLSWQEFSQIILSSYTNTQEKEMKVTFHMKSGAAITVEAEELEITKQNGNDLSGYSLTSMKRPGDLFYVRIEDVSAITTKE